ncbi:MAG: galactosyldiacylglycerol synthase [candidate division Zixibacteria bacterium]|nr:galactosyldiacylglycerol synthase [candidate division Zixibacteria bacterium]
MVKLYDKRTGQYLGRITEEELQFLIDNLEEESLTDIDYYVNRSTLALLKEKGISEGLAKLIESAMGKANEIEIKYEKV